MVLVFILTKEKYTISGNNVDKTTTVNHKQK